MDKELTSIIEILKLVRTNTKTKVTDEVLFENAVKIYISQEIGKQRKFETRGISKPTFSPATQAQIEFLKNRQVKIKNDLSKQEAFIMISNYKNNLKKENI